MSIPERLREPALVALVALALPLLFLYGNPLLDPEYYRQLWSDPDIAQQSLPWKTLIQRTLREGRLPLANPHVFGGMPFAGNPQAQLFYPGTLLILLLDVRRALAVALVLHLGLAFVGAYLLGRHLYGNGPAGRAAAAFAAIAYSFSGSMSTQVQQTAISHTSAWIPLFLWGLLRRRTFPAAIGSAGIVLAGHTQIASYALTLGLIVLFLDAYRAARERRPRAACRDIVPSILGLAWGAMLAAVLLIPAAELLSISMRGAGTTRAFASVNAFADWHFPLVGNPAAFASLNGDRYWTYPFVGSATLVLTLYAIWPSRRGRVAKAAVILVVVLLTFRPILGSLVNLTKRIPPVGGFYLRHWDLLVALGSGWAYTSILIPVAVLTILHMWRPQAALPLAIAAFLAIGFALGPEGPVLGLLYRLPVLGEGRGAVRFFHPYAALAAALAAAAVARALSARGRRAWVLGLPFVMLLGLVLMPWRQRWPTIPFLLSAAGAAVWLLARAPATRAGAPLARYVPHALVFLELCTFGTRAERVSDPALFRYVDLAKLVPARDPSARVLIIRNAPFGYFDTALGQNSGAVTGFDAALGYDPLALRTATLLVNAARTMATYDPDTGALADLRDMAEVAGPDLVRPDTFPILDLLRARTIVTHGIDLLDPRRALPVRCLPPVPASRLLTLGGVTSEAYVLQASSDTVFRLPAVEAPMEIRVMVAPDPRLGKGFQGAEIALSLERAGEERIVDRARIESTDPALFRERRFTLPPPPAGASEIRLHARVTPLHLALGGFNWICMTRPQAMTDDPARVRALSERIRLVATERGRSLAGLPDPGGPPDLRVYENSGALPLVVAPRHVSGVDPMRALGIPGFDPAATLLVPGESERDLPSAAILEAEGRGIEVSATYEAEGPTTLLVTNARFPGQVARVDGQPARTRTADIHFIAVDVPGGRHDLHITYQPFSYRMGLYVTMIAWMAVGAAASWRGRRSERRL